ncbi:MAG: agmatine deiminase family protein [Bacteroidota bacterium]
MQQLIRFLAICTLIALWMPSNAQKQKSLPHMMTEAEREKAHKIGKDFTETDPPDGDIRPIAEFEPMESVLIRYPFGIPMNFIATLSEEITVTTVVANESEENTVMTEFENNGVNTENVTFIHASTDSYWTRDYGPWYIEYGNHDIGIVNFPYNRPRPGDDDIPIAVSDSTNVGLFGMDIIHCGGNYMADGLNSAASTNLVIDENSDYTEEEINNLMEIYLGVTTYHINEDPLGEYIKHIDCWGKFLGPDKILIGEVPESDSRYEDFEAVADYYENATSAWGTSYEVYRIYTPGGTPATPYTNSLILNDRVFVPLTGSEWDDEAIQSYENAMPGYEIIGVDEGSYNWQNTDALHCRTHEMADRDMLKIKHTPITGEVEDLEEHTIEAEIIPFSDEPIYEDSLKVFYKLNDENNYSSVTLQNTGGYNYEAAIPLPGGYNEVSYFIHAADQSGRSENHPYIGAPDPHTFTEVAPPELTTRDTTIFLNVSGTANINGNEVIVNASGTCNLVDTTFSKSNFNCSALGQNTIEITVEDCNGITADTTAVVTVEDTIAPLLSTTNTTVELNNDGQASITGSEIIQSVSENCSINDTVISQTEFSSEDIGTTSIDVTIEDFSGNSITKTTEITILENASPTLITKDTTLTLDDNGNAFLTPKDVIANASDNGTLIDSTISQTNFSCSEDEVIAIDITLTDGAGNTTSKQANVTIEDNIAPVFTTKDDTAFLNGEGLADIVASDIIMNASDNCNIADTSVSQTNFSSEDLGEVTTKVSLEDPSENITTHTSEITIKDTVSPSLTVKNISIELDENGKANISKGDVIKNASDNCNIADTTVSQTKFTFEDLGTVTIDVTIEDISGNSTIKPAEVTIKESTKINEIAGKGIHIYPNPVKGKLNLEFKEISVELIQITDMAGNTVVIIQKAGRHETIDLSGFDQGIYIIQIYTKNGNFTKKIIKR